MLHGLRTFAFFLAFSVAAVSPQSAGAQASDFPSKTVRIVIPFSADPSKNSVYIKFTNGNFSNH